MFTSLFPSGLFLFFGGAAAALFLASLVTGRRGREAEKPGGADQAVYLFEGEVLVDSSAVARALIAGQERGAGTDLARLTALLRPRFPDLAAILGRLAPGEQRQIAGREGGGWIDVSRWGARLRIALREPEEAGGPGSGAGSLSPASLAVAATELQTLRAIGDGAPLPIWREGEDGQITWANRAYLDLAALIQPAGAADWPPHRLFAPVEGAGEGPAMSERQVQVPGAAAPLWFEVTALPRPGERMCFAVEVTRMVAAETARRSVVQVLTKTFAQLATGLAIFDRERRLVIFNPAFLDLTALPVGFVSARPSLAAVLDRLRDGHILPEPKNYRSWREQVLGVEAAAEDGTYLETWVLPGGQTWRVSGRPHPDGAIAFFFEDISGEVALTRHFREELGLAQAVIDEMDEAVAVFSAGGRLAMTNAAYTAGWGRSEERLQQIGLEGEIGRWRQQATPSPLWERLRQTARNRQPDAGWSGHVVRKDGRTVRVRVTPLAAGALMVGFLPLREAPAGEAAPAGADGEDVLALFRSARAC